MYWIMENYSDRLDVINFDEIYQESRVINADYIIDGSNADQKYFMTN